MIQARATLIFLTNWSSATHNWTAVADTYNNTIRMVSPVGVVTTLAGSPGHPGGTDGTGSSALFLHPRGLIVDAAGNIFIADSDNSTIRKMTSAGVVTTLAGSAGQIGNADGIGGAARFYSPVGVAVDALGDVYVGDSQTETIRKITPDGGVTTLAGGLGVGSADGTGGSASFNGPSGVAVDAAGNVYVADTTNDTIRKITPAGAVTTLAGGAGLAGSADGTGNAARFNHPEGIAVDGFGNIFVADVNNSTIRKITSTGTVTTFAGSPGQNGSSDGTGGAARFNNPLGVAADGSGNVYVADTNNHTVRKITPAGVVTTLAGNPAKSGGRNGTGSAAQFYFPDGIAADTVGNIYLTDLQFYTIRKITPVGVVTTLAGGVQSILGSKDGVSALAQFFNPLGVAVDGKGNVYVADYLNNSIRMVSPSGYVTTLAGGPGPAGTVGIAADVDDTGSNARFYGPEAVAVDSAGTIYVADTFNESIRKGIVSSAQVAPDISFEPVSAAATAGQALHVNFTLVANGTPTPTFLWQVSADGGATWSNLSDNTLYSGSATATLTLTSALASMNGDQFQCVTSNTAGTATSSAVTLTVTKVLATVTLGNLSQAFTGSSLGATATTSPAGLTVTYTYNGNATVPTAPGSYSVVATVSDANYQGTATGTLVILANFAAYQAQFFSSGQLADPTVSGPSANPAHDGMVNLLKYAFGLDPTLTNATAGLPVAGQSGGALTLSYIRRHDVADLTYTVEVSSDLVTWQSGPDCTQELSVTPIDAQRDQVVAADLTPVSGTGRHFIRLKVTQGP